MQLVLNITDLNEIRTQVTKLGEILAQVEKFRPGPLHGQRERHPHEAHQVEDKSIQLYILHMFYVQFFKPNRYELVS